MATFRENLQHHPVVSVIVILASIATIIGVIRAESCTRKTADKPASKIDTVTTIRPIVEEPVTGKKVAGNKKHTDPSPPGNQAPKDTTITAFVPVIINDAQSRISMECLDCEQQIVLPSELSHSGNFRLKCSVKKDREVIRVQFYDRGKKVGTVHLNINNLDGIPDNKIN